MPRRAADAPHVPVKSPRTAAEATRLIAHAEAGRVPAAHAAALHAEIAKAHPDVFGDPGLKSKLEGTLKKVQEGLFAVGAMTFGWTRELIEGTPASFAVAAPSAAPCRPSSRRSTRPASRRWAW